MGLLDEIKGPRAPRVRPLEAALDGADLRIAWEDGRTSRLPLRYVRQQCPCAGCVEEFTGRRTLDPESVPADVRPVSLAEVGRYALQIRWTDGHETGLYSWELLRHLDDARTAPK
jgi:DUF971 family protein